MCSVGMEQTTDPFPLSLVVGSDKGWHFLKGKGPCLIPTPKGPADTTQSPSICSIS